MDSKWLNNFFKCTDLWPNRTGQGPISAGTPFFGGRYNYNEIEDIKNKNIGLGWMYYGIVRLYKPKLILSIGSGRGFMPIILAKGIKDNQNKGKYIFIDPSIDDDFWKNPKDVKKLFKKFDVDNVIQHVLLTTQEFVKTKKYNKLKNIDILVIDGSHFYEFVKFDYFSFKDKLSDNAIIIFHDTISRSKNPKWSGPRKVLLEILKKDKNLQEFDFKFGAGLTIVQKKFFEQKKEYLEYLEKNWHGEKDEF